jgi:hypothetical protein
MKFPVNQVHDMIEEHPFLKEFIDAEDESSIRKAVVNLMRDWKEEYLFAYTNAEMTEGGCEMLSPLSICVILNKKKHIEVMLDQCPDMLKSMMIVEVESTLEYAIVFDSDEAIQFLLEQEVFIEQFKHCSSSMFTHLNENNCANVILAILNIPSIASTLTTFLLNERIRRELAAILPQFLRGLLNKFHHSTPSLPFQLSQSEAQFFVTMRPHISNYPGNLKGYLENDRMVQLNLVASSRSRSGLGLHSLFSHAAPLGCTNSDTIRHDSKGVNKNGDSLG